MSTIAFVIFLMAPLVASACPCLALEADGKDKAKFIFTGTVTSVQDLGSQHQRSTFKIISSEKGPSSGEVTVVSDNSKDTGCSAQFKQGDKYTVYTYEGKYLDFTSMKNVMVPNYTNACSRKNAS